MEPLEILVAYAVLVLLSVAVGTARESLLALRAGVRGGNAGARNRERGLDAVLARSDEHLLTILIVNNLAKLGGVCALFFIFYELFGAATKWLVLSALLALAIGAVVVLLVAELLPRHIARADPERALGWCMPLVRVLYVLVFPVRWVTERLVRLLKRAYGIEGSIFPLSEPSHALLDLIEASEENGELEEDDRELISSIIEFGDTIVREVMVPRVDMVCVDDETTLAEAQRLIVDKGHSRIPVYHDDLDHVIGVLYAKDLLAFVQDEPLGERRVGQVLHEPMFVPETKRVAELLREFQKQRLHIAIVVDEYGGTSGLVTIEDLLEEIVGEIQDEYDAEPPLYEPDGRGGFVVDAKMPIAEIEHDLGIELPEDDEYDTLGGFLFTRLGKVPGTGDVLKENGVEITVLDADERRIHKVRLTPTTTRAEADDAES